MGHRDELAACLTAQPDDLNRRNRYGQTPWHVAIDNGHGALVEDLLDRGAGIDAPGASEGCPLSCAVGDPDLVALILKRGANPNLGNKRKVTPLHRAASMRHVDMTEQRIEAHGRCIDLLIDAGANVNARDANGETPLHRAVVDRRHRRRSIASSHSTKSCRPEAKDAAGRVPVSASREERGLRAGMGGVVFSGSGHQRMTAAANMVQM